MFFNRIIPGVKDSYVASRHQIKRFNRVVDNPYLVSFPRTGSHWLRMMMEKYFEQPTLVRTFYYPGRKDFLLLHTHDMDFDVERKNVMYLYRDPVETVYSQMQYDKEDLHDNKRVEFWADVYARHLDKWLNKESFTNKKTILRYDRLKNSLGEEFEKVCRHLNRKFDQDRIESVAREVSKAQVKKKTSHDAQVVSLDKNYGLNRDQFSDQHANVIWDTVLRNRMYIESFLKDVS